MFFNSKAKMEQRERIIAYKRVFGSVEGKIILFDLMNRYHILNSHHGDGFKEGQRSAILFILSQCNINIKSFDELMKGEDNDNNG